MVGEMGQNVGAAPTPSQVMGVPPATAEPPAPPLEAVSVSSKAGGEAGASQDVMGRKDVVRIEDATKFEVYVCFEGPLGAHLKQEFRDKICKGEYMEIFLLPLGKFNLDRVKPDDSK